MKLLLSLSYPFFVFISFFVPRNKKIWVFGCYDGYKENTRYFFEYSSKKKDNTCYWLANSNEELSQIKSYKLKVVLKNSFYGYWISSRAYMSFICTGFSDVNRLLALNSKVINFWHGTPIKKVYLDSKHDLNRFGKNKISRFLAKTLMMFLNNKISFYYASNKFEQEIVCNASGMKIENSIALGSPRYDKIRTKEEKEDLEIIRKKFDKIILFAPTWREDGKWIGSYKINNKTYDEFNEKLKEINALLIINPHPLTNKCEILNWGLKNSENIIFSEDINIKDINYIYFYSDILITDISSAIFDYLIFAKPILLFMPDINIYLSGDRGIYEYFENELRENVLINWNQLLSNLDNTQQEILFFKNISQEISQYKNTNKAIYNDVINRFYKKDKQR